MIPGQQSNHLSWRKSFGFALQGFLFTVRTERNIRVMLVAMVAAIATGFILRLDAWRWCIVLLCCGVVIFGELMNTAIETIVDLVSPEYHPLAGHAKDISAAAVLWLSAISAVVGLIVFISRFLELIG